MTYMPDPNVGLHSDLERVLGFRGWDPQPQSHTLASAARVSGSAVEHGLGRRLTCLDLHD